MMHEPSKAAKLPPLIPEHKKIIVLRGAGEILPRCALMSRLNSQWIIPSDVLCSDSVWSVLPEGSRLLHHEQRGENHDIKHVPQTGHPKDRRGFLPEPLKEAMQGMTKLKDHEIAKIRSDWFQKWTSRMQALEPRQKKLTDSMHADLGKVVAPKKDSDFSGNLGRHQLRGQRCVEVACRRSAAGR